MVRNGPKPGAKPTFAGQQEAAERAQENLQRKLCTGLKFWLACGKPACRRKRGCAGDAIACFSKHWALLPGDFKAYWRACMKAAQTTSSIEEIDRAGNAAREIHLKYVERSGAISEGVQPERAPESGTDARVRRL